MLFFFLSVGFFSPNAVTLPCAPRPHSAVAQRNSLLHPSPGPCGAASASCGDGVQVGGHAAMFVHRNAAKHSFEPEGLTVNRIAGFRSVLWEGGMEVGAKKLCGRSDEPRPCVCVCPPRARLGCDMSGGSHRRASHSHDSRRHRPHPMDTMLHDGV